MLVVILVRDGAGTGVVRRINIHALCCFSIALLNEAKGLEIVGMDEEPVAGSVKVWNGRQEAIFEIFAEESGVELDFIVGGQEIGGLGDL